MTEQELRQRLVNILAVIEWQERMLDAIYDFYTEQVLKERLR